MRFPQPLELEVIRSLVDHPDDCITFPDHAYRDGHITIYRDGLSHRLVRYLYEKVTGEPPPRYLLPNCKTKGCQNFHHFEAYERPYALRLVCPNGHPYTARNTLTDNHRRCRRCRDAYNARRRKGTGGKRDHCRKNHRLTADNVYLWRDADGIVHRRCRRCMITYQRNYRKDHA